MKKRCGGCQHWLRVTLMNGSKIGLCQLKDGRSPSDNSCNQWRAKPYKRVKFKYDEAA